MKTYQQSKTEQIGASTWLPIQASQKHSRLRCFNSRGFTLVELLVVIAIVAVLATVGFLGTSKMMTHANTVTSMNSLKQLASINHTFSIENNGKILHESATIINGAKRQWHEVLLDLAAPEAATLNWNSKSRKEIALSLGFFGDKQALKKARGKLPESGGGAWRTFAYNNIIGFYDLNPGQTIGWGNGARYTHQVESPQKLILFSHAKLGPNGYYYILQRRDVENQRMEFDIYGGKGIAGFYDGHVEVFSKKNFPSAAGINPDTNSPYTESQVNEFYCGRSSRLTPLPAP